MAVKASAQITLADVAAIESVTRYYLLQASTLAEPAKPTENPPSGSWVVKEPSYTGDSTNNMYTTELVVWKNGDFDYSEVSLSSSYEAAKAAYNQAVAAGATADEAHVAANAAQSTATQAQQEIERIGGSLTDIDNVLNATGGLVDRLVSVETTYVNNTDLTQTSTEIKASVTSGVTEAKNYASGLVDTYKTETENYIRLTSNGLIIGKDINNTAEAISQRLNNNKTEFVYAMNSDGSGGLIKSYISTDRSFFETVEAGTRLYIGKFAFTPRANGNLSLKKVVT